MGNVKAKAAYREEVTEGSLDLLRKKAAEFNVMVSDVLDSPEEARVLAERLSSVVRFRPVEGDRVTTVVVPDGTPLVIALTEITAANGAWNYHSDAPPAWVESNDPTLQAALASHYGCAEGMPEDWPGPPGANWGQELTPEPTPAEEVAE